MAHTPPRSNQFESISINLSETAGPGHKSMVGMAFDDMKSSLEPNSIN
jgi:hypothetical protein